MKEVIRIEYEKNGDLVNYGVHIDGDDPIIVGAIVCMLNQLIEDGKHDLITRSLELSTKDLTLE